jgi:hypothetical protein
MKSSDNKVIKIMLLVVLFTGIFSHVACSTEKGDSPWSLSFQYLGLTYHPHGGTTPEVYPLKFDEKAYLVLDVGAVVNLDYRFNKLFFFRFTSALYGDCAMVMAGAFHAGPRMQFTWAKNSFNFGLGPIFCFRQDWHRFEEYTTDDFYGNRVYKGWQYRLFPIAIEFEYLRRINSSTELQWSILPGVPSVVTFMFGARFQIPRKRHDGVTP